MCMDIWPSHLNRRQELCSQGHTLFVGRGVRLTLSSSKCRIQNQRRFRKTEVLVKPRQGRDLSPQPPLTAGWLLSRSGASAILLALERSTLLGREAWFKSCCLISSADFFPKWLPSHKWSPPSHGLCGLPNSSARNCSSCSFPVVH